MTIFIAVIIFLSFLVSSSCGLGGSLILIPVLSAVLGIKEGIVVASILLGINNLVKVFFFRRGIKLKPISFLLVLMIAGTVIGSFLMLKADTNFLTGFLIFHLLLAFFIQRKATISVQRKTGLTYSFLSGFCSGLSGTSGPLKGLAVKCYMNEKLGIVAAASVLSLATDTTKSVIYLSQYTPTALTMEWFIYSIVVMPIATALGRYINQTMSLKAYEVLFYFVMTGYVFRLVF